MILDPKTSRRIFELARDQQEELGEWDDEEQDDADDEGRPNFSVPRAQNFEDEDEDDLERYEQDDYEEEVEEIVSVLYVSARETLMGIRKSTRGT